MSKEEKKEEKIPAKAIKIYGDCVHTKDHPTRVHGSPKQEK